MTKPLDRDTLAAPAQGDASGDFPLIFERSQRGRRAAHPPRPDGESLETLLGAEHLRAAPPKLQPWG